MESVRILLTDDHKLIRDALRGYLGGKERYNVVAEASDGNMALEKLREQTIDLVLMDINMEPVDGIEATRMIKAEFPQVKVIALSMLKETHQIKRMLAEGASGYLLKSCDQSEILHAIDTVMMGGQYFSREVTEVVMSSLAGKPAKPKAVVGEVPLSDREKEVLHLIVKEYTNREIADALFISPRTVDAHKRNLLEKTGSKNVAGLVLYAISQQLFDDL